MIQLFVHKIRSHFQRARLRTQLIVTVNIFVAIMLAGYLYIDFQQSVQYQITEKSKSLSDEARIIHAAVQEQRLNGVEAVQRHIDTVCATMNSGDSPGHTIEVTLDGVRFVSEATEHLHDHSSPWSELVAGSFSVEGVKVRVGERRKPLVAKVRRDSLEDLGVLAGTALFGALILNVLLVRLVTRPLEKTLDAVRDVGQGKFVTTVDVNANFELSQLADEVSKMSRDLARRNADRNAQVDRARRLQSYLIPTQINKTGIEIAIEFHPADQIAGDFVDVLECPNGDTLLCVADVVGHGIHAAMGSAVLKALLLTVDLNEVSPSVMLSWINRRFCLTSLPEDFASMILMRVSTDAKSMVYASAGHELGYLRHKDGTYCELNSSGMVLGVDVQAEYEDIDYRLHPNDLVALLSDGVSETFNSEQVILGRSAVSSVVQNPKRFEANAVANEIVSRAVEHRGESPALDDMTVLVLKIKHQNTTPAQDMCGFEGQHISANQSPSQSSRKSPVKAPAKTTTGEQ